MDIRSDAAGSSRQSSTFVRHLFTEVPRKYEEPFRSLYRSLGWENAGWIEGARSRRVLLHLTRSAHVDSKPDLALHQADAVDALRSIHDIEREHSQVARRTGAFFGIAGPVFTFAAAAASLTWSIPGLPVSATIVGVWALVGAAASLLTRRVRAGRLRGEVSRQQDRIAWAVSQVGAFDRDLATRTRI